MNTSLARHPCCPKCSFIWKTRTKQGLKCRKCYTVYDDKGNEIQPPKPKEKGNVAGKITIPQYRWQLRRW